MAIEIRKYSASFGAKWFKAGAQLFMTKPFTFSMMYLFIAILGLVSFLTPLLQIPVALAAPFLFAGFYAAALKRQQGQNIALADILNGFSNKERRISLFRLAIYQMGAGVLLSLASSALFADIIAVLNDANMDVETAQQQLAELFNPMSALIFFLLYSLYLAAFAFAVPLVYFGGHQRIMSVLKASLAAFFTNFGAMAIFGAIITVLMVLSALLSFIPLLLVLPIWYISLFIAFQAMFMPNLATLSNEPQQVDKPADDGRFDA